MVKNIIGLIERMTIYALSSGPGLSGIGVIRVSGDSTAQVVKKITAIPTKNVEKQITMIFSALGSDGGLFVLIGKKR